MLIAHYSLEKFRSGQIVSILVMVHGSHSHSSVLSAAPDLWDFIQIVRWCGVALARPPATRWATSPPGPRTSSRASPRSRSPAWRWTLSLKQVDMIMVILYLLSPCSQPQAKILIINNLLSNVAKLLTHHTGFATFVLMFHGICSTYLVTAVHLLSRIFGANIPEKCTHISGLCKLSILKDIACIHPRNIHPYTLL